MGRYHCSLIACANVHWVFRPSIDNSWHSSLEGHLWLATHDNYMFSNGHNAFLGTFHLAKSSSTLTAHCSEREQHFENRNMELTQKRWQSSGNPKSVLSVFPMILPCPAVWLGLHGLHKGLGLCRNCGSVTVQGEMGPCVIKLKPEKCGWCRNNIPTRELHFDSKPFHTWI